MNWEQRIIGTGLVAAVTFVVIETMGIYGVWSGESFSWIERYQTLIAALLAIGGVGWQLARQRRLAREEMDHIASLAGAARREDQLSIARTIRPDIVNVLAASSYNKGVLDAFSTAEHYRFTNQIVGKVWIRPNFDVLESARDKFGQLGQICDLLFALQRQCVEMHRQIAQAKEAASQGPCNILMGSALFHMFRASVKETEELCIIALKRFSDQFSPDLLLAYDLNISTTNGRSAGISALNQCQKREVTIEP